MAHNSPRLNILIPDPSDQVNAWPTNSSAQIGTLDDALLYSKGPIANRPAVGSVVDGYVYACTDVQAVFLASNGGWQFIPPNGGSAPIGTVMHYVGSSDPVDADGVTRWLVLDGRAISRTSYATFYAQVGTTYGSGNGSTTFNIPNGHGRVINGVGSVTDTAGNSQTFTLAESSGELMHQIATSEIPSHTHSGTTDNDNPDHAHNVASGGTTWAAIPQYPEGFGSSNVEGGSTSGPYPLGSFVGATISTAFNVNSGGASARHQHGFTTDNGTGGNGSHNNVQPYLALNHIVRVL